MLASVGSMEQSGGRWCVGTGVAQPAAESLRLWCPSARISRSKQPLQQVVGVGDMGYDALIHVHKSIYVK